MTFVWKTTCRRLQSSGGLARFAEGLAAERESREIETHLGACPSCQAIVADTLAVADLLKASVPAPPAKSLAASGSLWKSLEAEIAKTPQDRVVIQRHSASDPAQTPRLQRFGHWLATPGAMPFGAAAAAAVVVMVGGITVYQYAAPSPLEKQTASAATAVGESEFTLLPSPNAPSAITADASPKITGATGASRPPQVRASIASASASRAVDAVVADVDTNEIAPLQDKLSVRRSRSPAAPQSLRLSALPPAAPRAPAFQVAKAASAESFATSPVSAAPAQAADTARSTSAPGGFGGGISGGSGSAPTGTDSVFSNDADTARIVPPAPAMMARARVVPTPAPAPVVPGAVAFAAVAGSENLSGELTDVPAARSLLDMALRQRRQRSLFSYATR